MEKLTLKNSSQTGTTFTEVDSENFIANFGTFKVNGEAKVTLELSVPDGDKLTSVIVKTTCGCTAYETKQVTPTKYTTSFEYKNTDVVGSFEKTVFIEFMDASENNKTYKRLKIKLIGITTN